ARDLDGEIVLRDGLDGFLLDVGVPGDVDRLDGHVDFVESLPRPFEVRPTRRDHANVGIIVAEFFLGSEESTELGIVGRGANRALNATESGEHTALSWTDGVNADEQREHGGQSKTEHETED